MTLISQRLWTGTGHGASNHCFIGGLDGIADPVDATAADDYVCASDTVGYQLSYNIAPSDTPTSVRISLNQVSQANAIIEPGNFCASDPYGTYTATRNNTAGTDCTFTFPAGATYTGAWRIGYATYQGTSSIWTPTWTVRVDGATAATRIPVDGFQTLAAPVVDAWLRTSPTSTFEVIDGQVYARYTYFVYAHTVNAPGEVHDTKGIRTLNTGTRREIINATTSIDLTDLPEGTILTAGTNATINGDGTATLSATALRPGDGTLITTPPLTGTVGIVYASIPLASMGSGTTVFDARIFDTTITGSTTTGFYTHGNFAGYMPQPGEGAESSYSTANVNGTNSLRGSTLVNNDWHQRTYTSESPTGIMTKDLVRDADGVPSTIRLNESIIAAHPAGTDYWTHLRLRSYPYQVRDSIVLCDAYRAETRAINDGLSRYDGSREPIVQAYSYGGDPIPVDYQLYFRTSSPTGFPSVASQCGTPTDLAGWSTDPTGADTVKIVLDGGYNLLGDGVTGVDVWLPFSAGEIEDYPDYPEATAVRDNAAMAIDPVAGSRFSPQVGRLFYVAGPRPSLSLSASFVDEGGNTLSPERTQYTAGSAGSYAVSHGVFLGNVTPQTDRLVTVSGTLTLDHCMAEPEMVLTSPQARNFTYTIDGGDPGPDGLPCTGDDGEPPVLTYSYDVELSTSTDASLRDTSGFRVDFTVPPYASAGRSATAQVRAQTDYAEPGVPVLTRTQTNNFNVVVPAIAGQSKSRTHIREEVGTQVGWQLVFFNNTPEPLSSVRFIDVLPYDGDGRGSVLEAPLTGVTLDTRAMTGATVYVTGADPRTLSREARDHDPSDPTGATWCVYDTAGCPDGEITAVLITYDVMEPGQRGILGVTTETGNQADGNVLVNNLGIGSSTQLLLPVPASRLVRTELWVPNPGIALEKSWVFADGSDSDGNLLAMPGDVVRYALTATNTGNTPLWDVEIDDPMLWSRMADWAGPAQLSIGDVPVATWDPTPQGPGEWVGIEAGADTLEEYRTAGLPPEGTMTLTVPLRLTDDDFVAVAEDGVTTRADVLPNEATVTATPNDPADPDADRPDVVDDAAADVPLDHPQVSVIKVGRQGAALPGAQFVLTGEGGAAVSLTADASGTVFLSDGLMWGGEYTLTETHAPPGHSLLARPVTFTVDVEGVQITSGAAAGAVFVDEDDVFRITVTDQAMMQLPHTGGVGMSDGVAVLTVLVALGALALHVLQGRRSAAALGRHRRGTARGEVA
ncbi:MAG: prealbumin-like fold domain-containing protein [Actinomycetia bacterium]|nr:prealbumin-like fold domain-containing protein [Actinomycetes bacterium]